MPEDYYGGGEEDQTSASPAMDKKPESDDDSGEQTTLIPMGMFAGKEVKPDDEFMFKVVKIYDDEVEIKYATGKKDDSEMSKADGMMDKMAESNMES